MDVRDGYIVKYYGDIQPLADRLGIHIDILSENYGFMELTEEELISLRQSPEIESIEKQRLLCALDNPTITASCITAVQQEGYGLTGRGILIAILDTGIDYFHNDFRNGDGTTRIAAMWDQNAAGTPPDGFTIGVEYSEDEINRVLNGSSGENVPEIDPVGHGTAVAGAAAGNGRASNGNYAGSAPEATLLIVRLAQDSNPICTSDVNVMRGIKYAIDKAVELKMPLVINIGWGTNQGAHDGSSLFEQYIDSMADRRKTAIIIPTGNEGASGKHFEDNILTGETVDARFTVESPVEKISVTLLKSFVDEFQLQIIDDAGHMSDSFDLISDQTTILGSTQIDISVLQPTPYNGDQITTLSFSELRGNTLAGTAWTIRLRAVSVLTGNINMWLPVSEISGNKTSFSNPQTNKTLTIPSTASKVISVGGYNSTTNAFADFSGRGPIVNGAIKPDICAPAVHVTTTALGGGYTNVTGTSISGAITSGACALMMQWGIVERNDLFMSRQRLKSFLEQGALKKALTEYPSTAWGYGALCLLNSLDYAKSHSSTSPYSSDENSIPVQAAIPDALPNTITRAIIPDGINPATDESYLNFIIKYDSNSRRILSQYPEVLISSILQNTFAVANVPASLDAETDFGKIVYAEQSILCGLMENQAFDTSGITVLKNQPYLDLTGRGVLVGIVDTGIDYTLDTLRYENGQSKIFSIWDQTIDTGPVPDGFIYGTEFSQEQINAALAENNPRLTVPTNDEIGHGTFLTSLIAGRRTETNNEGVAPDAEIVAVKLKQAKQSVLNHSGIVEPGINAFESVDIVNGIEYLLNIAKTELRPIVIILGMGSNDGAHDGLTYFEQYMTLISSYNNVIVVCAVGNEGDKAHHAADRLFENEDMREIEFNVSENVSGFLMSMWAFTPDRLSVSLTTPLGEVVERRKFMQTERTSYNFVLEKTQINIDYIYPNYKNGSQAIFIRILTPQPGLWRLRVYGDIIIDGRFNIWMPVSSLWSGDAYFLQPEVSITATIPATAPAVITTGVYNSRDKSIFVSSSRGPNLLDETCPDLVAPGVNVTSVYPGGQNGPMTGTSVSAAITAGACALTLQWAVIDGNDLAINSYKMRTLLLIGLTQRRDISYPDPLWGYGELNIMESFRRITGNV